MKSKFLIFSFFVLTNIGSILAQTKTVNVATAGTLSNLITATEATIITNLTVTGNIDARVSRNATTRL